MLSTVNEKPQEIKNADESILSATDSLTIPEDPSTHETVITIRRGHSLTDLIREFSNDTILQNSISIVRLLENGMKETGEGTGVILDCLVEFWDEFYERCTTGVDHKVPYLRHDFMESEWEACASVFLFGWKTFEYIPVLLSDQFI